MNYNPDTMAPITSDCDAMRSPAHPNGPNHLGLCALQAGARAADPGGYSHWIGGCYLITGAEPDSDRRLT